MFFSSLFPICSRFVPSSHRGYVVPAGGALRMHFEDGFAYSILVSVNQEGLALLGDTEKIVPLGKQRIAALEDRGTLTATIKFASGEDVLTISGYASHNHKFKAVKGELKKVAYDSTNNIFQAQLAPGESGEAIIRVSAQ